MLQITSDERDVLRRELDWYEGALDDLKNCVTARRPDTRLRWRVHIALSLIDDLGWQHEDPRTEFYVTIDPRELTHWLRYTLEENDQYIDEQCEHLVSARAEALAET
jgi:hypothetical protein